MDNIPIFFNFNNYATTVKFVHKRLSSYSSNVRVSETIFLLN